MKGARGNRNFVVGEDVLDSVKISEGEYAGKMQEGRGVRGGRNAEAGGKLTRAFCYSDEKFRHADWMIMSLEKCENEPVDSEQSLRAEQPRRVVMTSGVSSRGTFLSSNPLNPRKPSFLIAPGQVSSLSFVPAPGARGGNSAPRKNTQLSLHPIVDETAEIHSADCRTSPQFHSSRRAFPGIRGDEKSRPLVERRESLGVLVARSFAIHREI